MQQLTLVLAALGGALVVVGGYHVLFVAPHLRRLGTALATHDALLGSGSTSATDRVAALERAVDLPRADLAGSEGRLAALERVARTETPRAGFVRFDAFPDVSSGLSYALALLNGAGDGVVISSIWSREETRTYGKAVQGYRTAGEPSREEADAIAAARSATS